MKLRSMQIVLGTGFKEFKPFKLNLYKGTQVVGFIDHEGNPEAKLMLLEEFSDEFEYRWFCLFVANDNKEIPAGARFVAMCRGTYWTPFALFEVTGCDMSELE